MVWITNWSTVNKFGIFKGVTQKSQTLTESANCFVWKQKICQNNTSDFQSYQLDSKKWFEYTTWNSNIERTLIKGQLMEYKKKTYYSKYCFIMRNLLLSVPSVKLLFGQSKVLKNTIWQSMQTITTKVKNVLCVQKLFWLRLPWIATLIKCTKIQVIFYEIGALIKPFVIVHR